MDDAEKYPSQLAERFQVRLPDGMRDKLRAAAELNNRSMNAEIVARLQISLDRAERFNNTIYAGGGPLEFDDELMDGMLSLMELARKKHEAKYGVVPPEKRTRFEGPFRVAEPGEPVSAEDFNDDQLREAIQQLNQEAKRLTKIVEGRGTAPEKPTEPSLPKLKRRLDLG